MCISRSVNIVIIAVFPLFVAAMLSSSSYARIDRESIVGIWLFDEDGGVDSERTFIKQLVQKYVTDDFDEDFDDAQLLRRSTRRGGPGP